MIAHIFNIQNTPNKGKGLFAKEFIPAGTIVCFECNLCKKYKPEEISSLSNEQKEHIGRYAYTKSDGSLLLPCDEAIYLNHSCNSNILDSTGGYDIIVKDIQAGEEATYDYRVFYENKKWKMVCECGEENCCKIVRCKHPTPVRLQKYWNNKLNPAMQLVDKVPQPLKNVVNLSELTSLKWVHLLK